ncbi:MAG: hypothetical protein CMA56_05180 [Euryarchaeota archaeon]|nr:hypothetical protein [Euryarchaeota archaeon]
MSHRCGFEEVRHALFIAKVSPRIDGLCPTGTTTKHGQEHDDDQHKDRNGCTVGHQTVVDPRNEICVIANSVTVRIEALVGVFGEGINIVCNAVTVEVEGVVSGGTGQRMTLRFTIVNVTVPVTVDGCEVNFVQVLDGFHIFDGVCIHLVCLFPNVEEFLCARAQIGFKFGHLEARVLIAIQVFTGCTCVGMRPVLVEADQTVSVGIKFSEPFNGALFAAFGVEGPVVVHVVIIFDGR